MSLRSLLTQIALRHAFGDVYATPVVQSFVSVSVEVIIKRWQPEVGDLKSKGTQEHFIFLPVFCFWTSTNKPNIWCAVVL